MISITRNALIIDGFIDGKLKKKSIDINFIDGLIDIKNPSVNAASIIKKINITDGKIIRR